MNIRAARKKLNQISKPNPENQNFHFFQFDANNLQLSSNTKSFQQDLTKKLNSSQQIFDILLKNQSKKRTEDKTYNQQKIQFKIPVFKNKKLENFSSSQKERYSKLGLQQFFDQDFIVQTSPKKSQQPMEQKIIKNLNNTYFRSTDNIDANRKSMINTLGIKKSSMSNYKVQWNEKDFQDIQIQWKEINYIPNKVFPCRKNHNVKSRIFSPKVLESTKISSQGKKKDHQIMTDFDKIKKTSSVNLLKNKYIIAKTSQNTQQIYRKRKYVPENKEKTGLIQENAKTLNVSRQFLDNKKVTKFSYDSQILRPKSENRKRPLTSRDSGRSRKFSVNQSCYMKSRKFSEIQNRSLHNLGDFIGSQKEQKMATSFVNDQELNSGVIVGKRINFNR